MKERSNIQILKEFFKILILGIFWFFSKFEIRVLSELTQNDFVENVDNSTQFMRSVD